MSGPSTSRAAAAVQSSSSSDGSSRSAIIVPGLARKFWTITSWTCPCCSCRLADREQRLDPLAPRLADPDQDPARERDALLAGEAHRLEPHGGQLVRRAEVRAAALGEPVGGGLEHDPLRRRHLAQRARAPRASSRRGSRAAAGPSRRARAGTCARGTRSSSRSRAQRARRARRGSGAPACRRA